MKSTQTGHERTTPLDGTFRILVADDDAELREVISTEMRLVGYEIIALRDGDQMYDYIVALMAGTIRVIPNLVVCDIRMPGLSGFQIMSALRNAGFDMPVILMTGFGDTETHERAADLGAALVLDKPFPIARLQAAVRELVDRRV